MGLRSLRDPRLASKRVQPSFGNIGWDLLQQVLSSRSIK